MSELRIQTARISYGGPDRLDVTRKAGSPFAPSWELLRWARNDGCTDATWETYSERYTAEMRRSYRKHRAAWDELLARGHVVLVCYCVDHRRCHRSLLASILVKLGAVYDGELSP
jgi:uncharacterized protein YeaO (DUF488 family)